MDDKNPSKSEKSSDNERKPASNFIRGLIIEDNKTGRWNNRVHTRFPPEPNGYLHIGHAKSICLNFGMAKEFGGLTNLRFDDTNPVKEDTEYVESIMEDVRWLGFDWEDRLYYASDYFPRLFELACQLIKKGKAFVCELNPEDMREYRGTLTKPGKNSPYRDRTPEENLDLFMRMRNGEFPDGSKVLRAKIDMSHPNINMRDPVIYRIRRAHHHRTGDEWCIYPMYDFTHCISDSIEKITHSLCTLEFENNRPLYDWFLDELELYHPQQTEFARLNLSYTVMSKRKLLQLVQEGFVSGWDDPRMPTICGLRRRGYTPESLRNFAEMIGVAKSESMVEFSQLEFSIRDHLNKVSPRVMAVLNPLKVVITNFPEDTTELLTAINNPEDESQGTREIPFTKEIFIEKDDFMENPPKKFFRLSPGTEVRLRYAYIIRCDSVIKDENDNILEIYCTYFPETKSGNPSDGRKVKSTIHWVSANHSIESEVRIYQQLFLLENPADVEEGKEFTDYLNPESLIVIPNAKVEPYLKNAKPEQKFQFERLGYFCVDKDSTEDKLVFNRTVTLKDTWAKIVKRDN
jgi:glutaminyl-tRNA synthetase